MEDIIEIVKKQTNASFTDEEIKNAFVKYQNIPDTIMELMNYTYCPGRHIQTPVDPKLQQFREIIDEKHELLYKRQSFANT